MLGSKQVSIPLNKNNVITFKRSTLKEEPVTFDATKIRLGLNGNKISSEILITGSHEESKTKFKHHRSPNMKVTSKMSKKSQM